MRQSRRRKASRLTDGTLEPEAWCLVGLSFFNIIFRLKVQFSSTQRSSHLILCLYEKRYLHPDVVIGTHEIRIPVESQSGSYLVRNLAFRLAEYLGGRHSLCSK